jgi:hypothetical protein
VNNPGYRGRNLEKAFPRHAFFLLRCSAWLVQVWALLGHG